VTNDPDVLAALLDRLDYPLFIVTTSAAEERAGCLVGFATQSSVDPIRFIVCLSKSNRTYRVATGAGHLGVHVVPRGAHDLAELFGGETGDDVDKFDLCEWRAGAFGIPLLERCPARFVGRILENVDAGDHVAFHLEPVEWTGEPAPPLMFQEARDIDAGHRA
jgi:flavin reductase (DIM6/NTAB) family NADH-FMN oxidoreductase RutF